MNRRSAAAIVTCIIAASVPRSGAAQSLKGSPRAVAKAYKVALDHKLTFFKTAAEIEAHVKSGRLVKLEASRDVALNRVSFPYALPEAVTFVKRFAARYRAACGEQLVVTSLTRPISRQPKNASSRSVHPAGMAIDIRRSKSEPCRDWLEGALLELEAEGVLDVTRERHPPHYHVALYPSQYMAFISGPSKGETGHGPCRGSEPTTYTVRSGESLWSIAQKLDTTVARLKALNKLADERIEAGQNLLVPSTRPCPEPVDTSSKAAAGRAVSSE